MGSIAKMSALIAAEKVQVAPVYNVKGDSLGSIDDIVIDRNTGSVAYAIMSSGGFMGFGNRYFSVPWSALKYDTNLGRYVVSLERDQLQAAPAIGRWL